MKLESYSAIADRVLSDRGLDKALVTEAVQRGMNPEHAQVVADCIDTIFQLKSLRGINTLPRAHAEESFELLGRAMATKHRVEPNIFEKIIQLAAKWVSEHKAEEPAIRSNSRF